jgi:UDP-N-acetylmuramate dehydrogenase
MSVTALAADLTRVPGVAVSTGVPLSRYTRFAIGGPADLIAEAVTETAFAEVVTKVRASNVPYVVIGGGSNLVVADEGFRGAVLRMVGNDLTSAGNQVTARAGATLQALVEFTVELGLAGVHVMTGIPGAAGAAVYGNAGAYGRSIGQSTASVRYFDGTGIHVRSGAQCEFAYRDSIFKRHKDWTIFSVTLELEPADIAQLREKAAGILDTRNRKYPQTMKCAGSIFKNLLLAELSASVREQVPARAIVEGKVPAAYFLEQAGAKGMSDGDIRVAGYHANLIYNEGQGTAAQVRRLIEELKRRVQDRFGLTLEEEVQYIGF